MLKGLSLGVGGKRLMHALAKLGSWHPCQPAIGGNNRHGFLINENDPETGALINSLLPAKAESMSLHFFSDLVFLPYLFFLCDFSLWVRIDAFRSAQQSIKHERNLAPCQVSSAGACSLQLQADCTSGATENTGVCSLTAWVRGCALCGNRTGLHQTHRCLGLLRVLGR